MTIGLCVLDFVPNLAFLAGAVLFTMTARRLRGPVCFIPALVGTILSFCARMLKATWKLLLVSRDLDFSWLSEIQFVLHAPGFLTLLIAAVLMTRKIKLPSGGTAVAIAPWKLPFLVTMTLASVGFLGILTWFSFKTRMRLAASLFITAVICLFTMSSLASQEQTAALQWAAESINSLGQIAFA